MIRCEVIENFNLQAFDNLSNIVRAGGRNDKGKLYVGDMFECDEDMVKYLSGGNEQKKVVVKVIEIKPLKVSIKKIIESAKDDKEYLKPIQLVETEDIIPIEWSKEVLSGKKKAIVELPKKKKSSKK